MLCSDGLHGSVPHGEIAPVLAIATSDTLGTTCEKLVWLAKDYGVRVNITVVRVWYESPSA